MIKQNSLTAYADRAALSVMQKRVYGAIRELPGITRQDISRLTGMPINSVSGRVADMLNMTEPPIYEGENVYGPTGRPRATLWAGVE